MDEEVTKAIEVGMALIAPHLMRLVPDAAEYADVLNEMNRRMHEEMGSYRFYISVQATGPNRRTSYMTHQPYVVDKFQNQLYYIGINDA